MERFLFADAMKIKDTKISAIGFGSDTLVIGDEKGLICNYTLGNRKSLEVNQTQQVGKNKIDKILINTKFSLAFVLTKGELYMYSLMNLENYNPKDKPKIDFKDITDILLNSSEKEGGNQILVINKKRKVKIFNIENVSKELIEKKLPKEIKLEETYDLIEWYEEFLVYTHKDKAYWVNITTQKNNNTDLGKARCLKYIQGSLLVETNNLGLFLEFGTVKSITPITLNPELGEFINFGEFKSNILAFHEKGISIFSPNDQREEYLKIQEKNFGRPNEKGRFIFSSSTYFIYITVDSNMITWLYKVSEVGYSKIKGSLLSNGKIEEALFKLNESVPLNEKPEKFEEFFLDCGWVYFNKGDFEKAYKYARLSNFNPFEFIYTFFSKLELPSEAFIHGKALENSIKSKLDTNQVDKIIKDDDPKKTAAAFKFLHDILLDKRNLILREDKLKEKLGKEYNQNFLKSELSLIKITEKVPSLTYDDMLNYLNMVLIRIMIKNKQSPKEIGEIIDNPFFNAEKNKKLFEETPTSNEQKMAQAYFFEKIGKYAEALKIWEEFGKTGDVKLSNEAKERTKKIFRQLKAENKPSNATLFQTYIQWLVKKFPHDAFEILITTNLISIEYFIETILKKELKDTERAEEFLIYYNKKVHNANYQTVLISAMIDKLFSKNTKDTPVSQINMGPIKNDYDELMKYLKKKDSVYQKETILEKVKGTWLQEAEIFLYAKLRRFDEALNRLLDTALMKDENDESRFNDIEKFCEEYQRKPEGLSEEEEKNQPYKPDIFDLLFLKLSEKYKECTKLKNEKLKKVFEDEMLKVLKKYGNVEKLNPVKALDNIPTHLNICEDILYQYLENVVKEYTSLTNKYKIGKNISDMALIYKEREVYDIRNKNVTIDNDTICELCRKKIGNTIFVVYPNMKVYHSKCAANPSICPTTGIDFTKKKIFN